MKSPCFGVDLGTTKSSIGHIVDGQPQLIPIDGSELIPSVVCFPADGPPLVGRAAVHRLVLDPDRTLRSTKRYMGTAQVWEAGGQRVTPVDVAAHVLRHLTRGAEAATGVRPARVVITVPAWFTQAQRSDTRRAGEQAGLEVVRLVNEPTAAALAHMSDTSARRTALVYDLGGGTFDASLVEQDGPVMEVRASEGDTWLGGDDVDEGLLAHVLERVRATDPPLADAIAADAHARMTLRQEVERCKRRLSEEAEATLRTPFLVQLEGRPRHVELLLHREDLEDIVMPLLDRTTACVDRLLIAAERAPGTIDELLLVGGSALLPRVWSTLRERYGLEGSLRVPPRRAVALGATIQAGLVDGTWTRGVLVDVTPYALSIGMSAGGIPGRASHYLCEVVTPRNAPLPARHTILVRTGHPLQERIRIPLYQGSDPDPRRNKILGEIRMEGLPPALADDLFRPIAVELRHDLDGAVTFTVTDQLSGMNTQGHIVVDGVEQAELAQRWVDDALAQGLELGDPYGRFAADPAPTAGGPARLPEAEELFNAVIAQAERVRLEAGPAADPMFRCVTDGREALASGELKAAKAAFEALQDLMFEAGFYL
jgi:molecular chaperone DnaK